MRETAAQKKNRIIMLLADYDARRREALKVSKELDALKDLIADTVPVGTYGDWFRGEGAPREILDQPAAKKALTDAGIAVPVKYTAPSVTVTHA
jgi:uncharacterized protein (DUF58 family)